MSDATSPINALTGLPVSDEQLRNIAQLAHQQVLVEQNIADLEELLEKQKEELTKIRDQWLPLAMAGVGMSMFKLSDGTEINVVPYYTGKIPSEDDVAKTPELLSVRLAAFKWLRDNNFDAIIKRNLVLNFGKGEDQKAEAVKQELMKLGYAPQDKSGVHPMTLKAFIRERIEAAQPIPQDLFQIHTGNRAKITPPNNK